MTRIAGNAAACWTAAAAIAVAGAGVVIACGLGHDVRHLLGFDFGAGGAVEITSASMKSGTFSANDGLLGWFASLNLSS